MPQNGAAVRLSLVPDPPPALAPGKPDESLEHQIGEATAAAVSAICRAWEEMQAGGLTATTRRLGAERIYCLYRLRQGMAEPEFVSAVRASQKLLRQNLDADVGFRRQHGPEGGEATISGILEELLVTVGKVGEFEAMAH